MQDLERYLSNLAAEIHRTAEEPTVDAVHDLRVAVRRATQALRLFSPGEKKLRKKIKTIRDSAAAVRDRDITLALLQHLRLPKTDPAVAYLRGQRDLAASQLTECLKKRGWQRRLADAS